MVDCPGLPDRTAVQPTFYQLKITTTLQDWEDFSCVRELAETK